MCPANCRVLLAGSRVIQCSLAALGAGGYSPASSRNLWSFVSEGIDLGPSRRELNDPGRSVTGVHVVCMGCACGPFLWYTPNRRTGGGTPAAAHNRRERNQQPDTAPPKLPQKPWPPQKEAEKNQVTVPPLSAAQAARRGAPDEGGVRRRAHLCVSRPDILRGREAGRVPARARRQYLRPRRVPERPPGI